MNVIDIHSHLNFPDFDFDRDEVIKEMKEKGFLTITVGTSFKTSKDAVELASQHENLFATIGVHPTDDEEFYSDEFEELLTNKVVAVGECGLDYFRGRDLEKLQRNNFDSHIEFALDHKLPLMIHARPEKGTDNAYEDVADILGSLNWPQETPRGNMHFFTGGIPVAKRLLEIGMTLSFDGPITFSHDYDELIEYVPLDMIHAETDAPFAAPAPYRGKRNNPLYVEEVIKRISEIKKVPLPELKEILLNNALRTFPGLQKALL